MLKYNEFKKLKRFANEQIIPALTKVELYDKALKLFHCSSFEKIAICEDCKTPHFAGTYGCKDKFCPICQKKRSLLWLTKVIPICKDLLSRGYHLNMLTYTIRTTDNMTLTNTLSILQNAFRYMTHEYKQYAREYNKLILGGIRSLEVKIGCDKKTGELSGLWHPHFHILVCTHGKVQYKELHKILYEMWNHSLRVVTCSLDEHCGSVNISSIKANDEDSLIKSLCEIFKYMTKFDWQGENVYELVTTMHKVRLTNSFGNFKYLISDRQIEMDMNKSYDEVQQTFCSYCGSSNFITFDNYYTGNMLLYDLKHNYEYLSQYDEDITGFLEELENETK